MNVPVRPSNEEMNELFIKASEDHQKGLLDSAEAGYLRLLRYFPQAQLLHCNLGLVYYEQENYENSRDSFARAAELEPEDPDILFNLGLAQKKAGDPESAINTFKRLIEADPESVDTLYNLAGCYKDNGRHAQAVETYLEVLRITPDHLSANNNLAFVYHLTGESERAVYHYQKVLDLKPDHQAAKHMLAALTGVETTSSPESYVRDVFDNYSPYFEKSLVGELEYRVPATIRQMVDDGTAWKKTYTHGLDLGCGTGLGGQAFGDMLEVLDGLDLSEKMIDLAQEKNIYRKLHAGNIVNFLNATKERYDFFLAADVFAYVGDLAETFLLLRRCACRDALFCFSTETLSGQKYQLQQTGRFAHAPVYIEEVAGTTGWKIAACQKTALRKEKGNWVEGDIWLLQLSDNA